MVLLGLVVVGTEAGFLCEKGQAKRAGRRVLSWEVKPVSTARVHHTSSGFTYYLKSLQRH
jgi:hypothetical protein